jgi:hypothetical protein
MGPKQKIKFFLLLAIFAPQFALAQIRMTEIMYDLPQGSDSGREWIEVYNSGQSAVDVTKLRLFENGTNHKITGNGALSPNAFAVIADNPTKFETDWPQYSGLLFDSTFALGNTGDTFELRDASSTMIDTVSFTSGLGAAGDGNSLNRSPDANEFTPHTPTPGAAMSSDKIAPKEKVAPPPKVAASKKSSKPARVVSSDDNAAPLESVEIPQESQVAAAGVTVSTAPWQWYLAAGMLALASAGAVVFARRFAKDEWDIVDESDS